LTEETLAMTLAIKALTTDAMVIRNMTRTPRGYTCPSRIAD